MLITFLTVISWIYSVLFLIRFTVTMYDISAKNKQVGYELYEPNFKNYEWYLVLFSSAFLVTKYFV